MKKILPLIILIVLILASKPAMAQTSAGARQQLRQQIKQENQASRQKAVVVPGMVVNAVLNNITGQTLTITKDNKTYTVTITANTKLRRRFWGKAQLTEFSVGDTLAVYGKWTSEEKTSLEANLIRNSSIQKRFGAFFGTISGIKETEIILKSNQRGEQKVIVITSTNIVNRKNIALDLKDLKVADRIRVKGLWDNKNNTITRVTQIKDYSQPLVNLAASPSPNP